jgi:SSS family solute:Na+ symporter
MARAAASSSQGRDADVPFDIIQVGVFFGLTALTALLTFWLCRRMQRANPIVDRHDAHGQFLAGGTLAWPFVAGSITLTNLSTDQLVGMNGNQMLLLAWWELAAIGGLLILAFVFLPIYYREGCTTTTELLEKKTGSRRLRATIGGLFLAGNLFIYLPIMLYTGSLFLKSMLDLELPILAIATPLALVGAAYAVFGGLRAVAVSDTISGVGVLGMALLVAFLAMQAIGWSFEAVPPERLTMIGADDSPIPWHTLLTGMLFIQIFYWSTNQTITQRAMAAPTLREGQKGVLAAAVIRLLIVPAIVVIPGVAAYVLFGDVGDLAYGMVVAELLPPWLSGAFGAMIAAAVLTSFNSVLNSSVTLWVCDFHQPFINPRPDVARLNAWISWGMVAAALMLVPVYEGADSIINLVQQLNGLLSMPILSAFIVCLLFRGVAAPAAIAGVIFGTLFYGALTFLGSSPPLPHYIHQMAVTLFVSVGVALAVNRFALGNRASLAFAA